MPDELHHVELHKHVIKAEAVARWIFADCYFDCDNEASERTSERVSSLHHQHGPMAVYGVAVNWAQTTLEVLTVYFHSSGADVPPILSMLGENFDAKILDADQRGKLSAAQFIQAVSHHDLEMAEALFLAASESSLADAEAFLNAVLGIALYIAHTYE